jgi:TRAP-type C4-dicarboxylate transport system permease small subunit
MSQIASQPTAVQSMMYSKEASEKRHRTRLLIAWIVSMTFVGAFLVYGFGYYTTAWKDRPFSPKHAILRPSGTIGVDMGMLGVLMFFIIFLYPLRKRWGWLGKQGNSRHWLDFHVILGTAAPLVIALHSSFKFGGIAGMAFWIMTAVTLSGFIGRYLYSQIPRSLNAAELTIKEIQEAEVQLRWNAEEKHDEIGTSLIDLFELPSSEQVARTPIVAALCWMIFLDIRRPFQVSLLRLRAAGFGAWLGSLFGILQTRNPELEFAIQTARKQASLSKRILFLSRTKQVFNLWHVIHRPFSYSFAILAIVHIVVALGMGYR